MIEQLTVDDLRQRTPAVWAQLDRLDRISDKLYIHIDMDVLDQREVMAHGNKVPNGPSSEQLAASSKRSSAVARRRRRLASPPFRRPMKAASRSRP